MAFEAPEQTDAAPVTGPLSVDDAINLLEADDDALAPDDGDAAAAADTDTEDAADDQAAGEDDAPDDDDPASEDDLAEDEEDEPPTAAIEPPKFWSAEEKAIFEKAPPEVQLLIAAKDAAAEKRVYEAKEKEAEARKEASIIAEYREKIDQHLERAEAVFKGRWEGVDFAEWAKADPQEAFAAKLEYDQEMEALQKSRTAAAVTEAEEHRQFLAREAAKLKESGHPLVDPEKGKELKAKLVGYLRDNGFDAEGLKWAGAAELTIAHKAFLYDQARARLAQKPAKQPPTEAKGPAPVRPAGAPPSRRETQAKQRKAVLGRAYATGKMDDAVAALIAMEG